MAGRKFLAAAAVVLLATLPQATAVAARSTLGRRGPLVVSPEPALPLGAHLLGPLAGGRELRVDVVLRPRDPAGLLRLATAVSTPGSPERGRYLTPAEVAARFAPSRRSLATVRAALSAAGLDSRVSADGFSLQVAGSAAGMERAFHTSLATYRLPGGRVAFANTAPARLAAPAGIAVQSVVGLSDLARYRPLDAGGPRRAVGDQASGKTTGTGVIPQACPAATEQQAGGYTADQLARAYGMRHLWLSGDLGQGATIGVFELELNSSRDVSTYDSCYGVHPSISYVSIAGGPGGFSYGSGEAALDIEDIAGLAPAAKIIVYRAPNNNTGPLEELQYIVDHPVAKIVTSSWGECEPFLGSGAAAVASAAQAEATFFEIAATEGQTWLSASGDSGSTDCYPTNGSLGAALAVDDPGSQPFVTSVGGTALHITSTGTTETAWNSSSNADGSGGGGISQIWPMPGYQAGASAGLHVVSSLSSGAPCQVASGYCREVPDVSADASPTIGYSVYYDRSWSAFGGTSAAAPLWAALLGLAEEGSVCGGRPLGFINPSLYALASSSAYTTDFHDVTVGSNDFTPSGRHDGRYPAGPGYDMATGLGTPRASKAGGALVYGLCSSVSHLRPGVTGLSPASGPAAGGGAVTISGYGLNQVTAVHFGAVAASFTYYKATSTVPAHIVAKAPPGTGTVNVRLESGLRTSVLVPQDFYTYTP